MIGKTFFRLQFQSLSIITLLYTYTCITVEKLQCVKMYFHSGKAVARLSCMLKIRIPAATDLN